MVAIFAGWLALQVVQRVAFSMHSGYGFSFYLVTNALLMGSICVLTALRLKTRTILLTVYILTIHYLLIYLVFYLTTLDVQPKEQADVAGYIGESGDRGARASLSLCFAGFCAIFALDRYLKTSNSLHVVFLSIALAALYMSHSRT